MLAVVALVLFALDKSTERTSQASLEKHSPARPLLSQIDSVVDTLFNSYQIDASEVKSWSVFTRDKRFIRKARRVFVRPEFVSLDFNHDLSRQLSEFGVRVVATERTKESTVSMHIISEGMVVETITFVLKRDLE
jgi:CO dehydrogenase/acetyl-CoA synthase epsilon subunit